MEGLEKYFKKKTKDITFMELKNKELPLPIITDKLVNEIKMGNLEEEIDQRFFIEGMVYILGTDPNFIHAKDYIELLNSYKSPIEDYIFYIGLKALEEDKYDLAAINFRALKFIYPENINAKFNYALTLEGIGQEKINNNKEEEGLNFLKQSTRELEEILDMDENYALAYYKLGFHYKVLGYFLKAKLIWSKYLRLDRDELRLREIREELDNIDLDALIETGITYLYREEYEKSLDVFLKLLSKMDKWWELRYLIGLSYKGLGQYESAVEFFQDALELNKEEADVYNELAIVLYNLGDINEAIEIVTKGIDNIKDDYKLYFNRGLFYLEDGNIEKGHQDIEFASQLKPNDENIIKQLEILNNLINKNGGTII